MRLRARIAGWLAAVLGTMVTGCGSEPKTALQIGITATPAAEVLYLAQERGLFAAEGVSVRLIEHGSASDVVRGFWRGQLDGMATSVVEVLQARERTSPAARIVMVTDVAGHPCTVLARPERRTMADLRGARIATEPTSVSMYVLLDTLEHAGLSLADMTVVPADVTEMGQLLADGVVDAAVPYAPWTQEIVRSGDAQILPGCDTTDAIDVLAFEAGIVVSRSEEIAGIRRAWDRSLAIATSDDVRRAMAARERLTPSEFDPLLHRADFLRSDEQWAPARRRRVVDAVAQVSRVLHANAQLTAPERDSDLFALPTGQGD